MKTSFGLSVIRQESRAPGMWTVSLVKALPVLAGLFISVAISIPASGIAIAQPPVPGIQRMAVDGAQPVVDRPPGVIVDTPLPATYCEASNYWVFVYATGSSVQYYRLDPRKRESYRTVMRAAAEGGLSPWAMRWSYQGRAVYLVNRNPSSDAVFDYVVAAGEFDPCAELSVRHLVEIVPAERFTAGRGPN